MYGFCIESENESVSKLQGIISIEFQYPLDQLTIEQEFRLTKAKWRSKLRVFANCIRVVKAIKVVKRIRQTCQICQTCQIVKVKITLWNR